MGDQNAAAPADQSRWLEGEADAAAAAEQEGRAQGQSSPPPDDKTDPGDVRRGLARLFQVVGQ